MLLAHCTVAPSLVDGIELHTHFESGLGVGCAVGSPPGGSRCSDSEVPHSIASGSPKRKVERSGDADDICRTQVTVRLDGVRASSLLEDPLGNHLLLFHGRHRDRIERWWHLAFG